VLLLFSDGVTRRAGRRGRRKEDRHGANRLADRDKVTTERDYGWSHSVALALSPAGSEGCRHD
jgi:hypothetical protein